MTHKVKLICSVSMCVNLVRVRFNLGHYTFHPYMKRLWLLYFPFSADRSLSSKATKNSIFLTERMTSCVDPLFGFYLWSPPGHPDMQSVVAARLGVSHSSAALIGVQQGAVLFRQDHGHHHGGTAHQSRLGEVKGEER